jgi:type IV secretory pathway VirB2 component (pilin)
MLVTARIIFATWLLGYGTWARADDSSQITSILTKLVELLQSNIARCLAVLAIVAVGYATVYLGKLPKERAVSIVLGICIVFGAKYILQTLGYGVV